MESQLGGHFQKIRLSKGIQLHQLAETLGYKSARIIERFEKTGQASNRLVSRLAATLEIEPATIEALTERDIQARDEQLYQDVVGFLTKLEIMPKHITEMEMPPEITTVAAAEAFATKTAKKYGTRVLLVLAQQVLANYAPGGTRVNKGKHIPGDTLLARLRGRKYLMRFEN